jgi:PAS domain S-box-containing protein
MEPESTEFGFPAALTELTRAVALKLRGAAAAEVLQAVLRGAQVSCGAAATALFVTDSDSILRLTAVCGPSSWDGTAGETRADPVPCCGVAGLGEISIVEDMHADDRSGIGEFAARHGISACWSFPVHGEHEQPIGSICAYLAHSCRPDSSQAQVMGFVAQFAALVLVRKSESELQRLTLTRLRKSEARYRSLTGALTSIVWTTDPDGRITLPQPTWERYTGQPWERHQDYGWMEAVHPEDREIVKNAIARARVGKDFYRADLRLWHEATRSYRHIEARGMPVFADDGELAEWIGTCLDVTVRKQAEQALQLADRRKDQFIAVLAHELRNPLAPIRNAVHILKRRAGGDVQLTWASGVIDRQVAHIARLLDDLLDVTRIARNKLELRKARVTLDSVIESALEASRPVIEQHGHHLEVAALAAPVYIDADPTRLAQVFSNLLNNAAKYTEPGGRIVLTLRVEGREAIVCVKDNGMGIDAQVLPRIFDMFSQAQPALPRAEGGLGIGLSLVRGLVEMHGGTVEAHSAGSGSGSEFVVRLPLAAPREASVRARESARFAGPSLRILVADDDRDSVESLSVFLQIMGHEVRSAHDGQQAVEVAREFRPDVALLDIAMPRRDGYEAATHIHALLPETLLVATTGWGQAEDVQKAAAAGFNHHLIKPVDLEQLERVLAAHARKTSRTTPA